MPAHRLHGTSDSVVRWSLLQVWSFVRALVGTVLLGPLHAVRAGRFSWSGFGLLLVGITAGVLTVGFVCLVETSAHSLFRGPMILRRDPSADYPLFWGLELAWMLVLGWTLSAWYRRNLIWEAYLATIVASVVIWFQLDTGFYAFSRSLFQGVEGVGGFAVPTGLKLLGPMWDRILVLAAAVCLAVLVFVGSLAELFFSGFRFRPLARYERILAQRYLGLSDWRRPSTTTLVTCLGIAIGIGALITVNSAMTGYLRSVERTILNANAHVTVQKYGTDFTEWQEVVSDALEVPGVVSGSPFTYNEALLSDGTRSKSVMLKGLEPATAGGVTPLEERLCVRFAEDKCSERGKPGDLRRLLERDQGDVPPLIVGVSLFEALGKPLGGLVELTTPFGMLDSKGRAPKRMPFRLAGVYESGMHEFDKRLTFTSLSFAQSLMGLGERVYGIDFRVREPERVETVTPRMMRAIGGYPYKKLDWRELNRPIFQSLVMQKIGFFLVLAFIVVVASFNIASMLFMAVIEKAQEIGLLKAIGAARSSITRIFVAESWMIMGLGSILGVVLGLAASWALMNAQIAIAGDVYMVRELEVDIQPAEVVMTLFGAFVISHLAALYPATLAARRTPVDALRSEVL